jgi:hypothetical protein
MHAYVLEKTSNSRIVLRRGPEVLHFCTSKPRGARGDGSLPSGRAGRCHGKRGKRHEKCRRICQVDQYETQALSIPHAQARLPPGGGGRDTGMRAFLTPRTSPHPLTPAPLRQSRIRECAAVVKGEFLLIFSFPSVFFIFLLCGPPTVFEDIPSPRHKRKRSAPSESETAADRPSAASIFDEHAAASAQLPAQPPPAVETAPPPPASESRAAKSSPFRPLLPFLLRYH